MLASGSVKVGMLLLGYKSGARSMEQDRESRAEHALPKKFFQDSRFSS